ncbi:MAG: hypothetical protein NTY95_07220 [Bacteroidia bacterium]|nr:hypothetical protein [Bacteroidia bacterium]
MSRYFEINLRIIGILNTYGARGGVDYMGKTFKEIDLDLINDNPFELIGKDWTEKIQRLSHFFR